MILSKHLKKLFGNAVQGWATAGDNSRWDGAATSKRIKKNLYLTIDLIRSVTSIKILWKILSHVQICSVVVLYGIDRPVLM